MQGASRFWLSLILFVVMLAACGGQAGTSSRADPTAPPCPTCPPCAPPSPAPPTPAPSATLDTPEEVVEQAWRYYLEENEAGLEALVTMDSVRVCRQHFEGMSWFTGLSQEEAAQAARDYPLLMALAAPFAREGLEGLQDWRIEPVAQALGGYAVPIITRWSNSEYEWQLDIPVVYANGEWKISLENSMCILWTYQRE